MNELQEKQLKKAKQHAISKGGKCLSTEYLNNKAKMLWKCENLNHLPWSATYSKILNDGTWCPECGKIQSSESKTNRQGLELAKAHALSKGGACLSTVYINSQKPLRWKCENINHKEWQANFNNIINNGRWCPECGIQNMAENNINPQGLEIAKAHAKSKNGECLSTEYKNSKIKMVWKCENSKHKEWHTTYNSVVTSGCWCPECSNEKFINENRVRLIFELFYGKSFPSIRPKWNVNFLTGRCLELDGYCETVKVAFEHDGEHHSQIVSYNNKHQPIINELMYRKCKDYEKKQNCKRQGVLLVNVPILEQKDRNIFQLFLDNVINSCKKCGLEMTFTDDQLTKLEKEFYTV
ncbi:zinc-ribbon domain-containing protein [Serratia marcescens]|uniref:zinc-ribbon domain-containing protein n=1 Tax=Serratia marcescens TaxID=615 RepID=UPI001F1556DE|nr:zinc-ribbon domain-containing protein [Serratia marcescens]